MFLFILFLVYSSFIFDIVMIRNSYMHMFVKSLIPYSSGLGGRNCVGMVSRLYLPTKTSYVPGHVVDRGCDIPVESYVVHSPNVDLSRTRFQGRIHYYVLDLHLEMFLMCRWIIDYTIDDNIDARVCKRLCEYDIN